MKFFKKWPWACALGLIAVTLAYATVTYKVRYTTTGTEVFRVESDGSIVTTGSLTQTGALTSAGPWKLGSSATGTAVTLPTTTTGSNFGKWVPVFNVGAAVIKGQVLIASNTGTGYVAGAPATLDLTNTVGVAAEAIASGVNGWMIPRGGGYAIILASGTVAIGDVLISSGSGAGYAWSDTTPTSGAQIGIAMSGNTAGSGNGILAIME